MGWIKITIITAVALILIIIIIRSLVKWSYSGSGNNRLLEQAQRATTWLNGCAKAIGKLFGAKKDERC